MAVSRRIFLGAAAAAPLISKPGSIPRRPLGRTGQEVSIVALGGGNNLLIYKEEHKVVEAIHRALDQGVNYVDTSASYGKGVSEELIGEGLKDRRASVFLATKVSGERTEDHAMRSVEESLRRLQTDRLDLVHIHDLKDEADLSAIESDAGVLKALYKLRDQKVTRFIGITSHRFPAVLKLALERHDFDCTQMALNAALVGMKSQNGDMVVNDAVKESFEAVALPVAGRKNIGVIAMKVYARGAFKQQASPEQLLGYALSLPVSTAVIGMSSLDLIDSNVAMARSFKPLSQTERRQLSERLADRNKSALDLYFSRHNDG